MTTLSDHRHATFVKAQGVFIGEIRLLTRAVFIVDINGIFRYIQVVSETSDEPDYNDGLRS